MTRDTPLAQVGFAFVLLIGAAMAQTLWPLPQQMSLGSTAVELSTAFNFASTGFSDPTLDAAYARYMALIFGPSKSREPTARTFFQENDDLSASSSFNYVILEGLDVDVLNKDLTLDADTDESYQLTVTAPRASISASTVYGALRGLETFSQLVAPCTYAAGAWCISSTPVSIADKPRFIHRGFLIDSARHFLPVPFIEHIIDSLSYNKFNVLHWHAVDAQSFPLESQAYPLLSQRGAWSPNMTYSQQDMKSLVEYARLRGIRVMIEIDVPGHSYAIGKAYPELTVNCPDYVHNINNIPLNPTLPETYTFLKALFTEMAEIFPEPYFHTGGDEVVMGCWQEDSQITTWMSQNGIKTYNALQQYFEEQVQTILRGLGKVPVNWQEIFQDSVGLPKDTIFTAWLSQDVLNSFVKAGYRGILDAGWYLDHLDLTWINFYQNELVNSTLTAAQAELIIGGEAAMWGEQVDAANFDGRVWPRAAAAAERLWSAQNVTDLTSALNRLLDHRCRLVRRGVESAPLQPGYCSF